MNFKGLERHEVTTRFSDFGAMAAGGLNRAAVKFVPVPDSNIWFTPLVPPPLSDEADSAIRAIKRWLRMAEAALRGAMVVGRICTPQRDFFG